MTAQVVRFSNGSGKLTTAQESFQGNLSHSRPLPYWDVELENSELVPQELDILSDATVILSNKVVVIQQPH